MTTDAIARSRVLDQDRMVLLESTSFANTTRRPVCFVCGESWVGVTDRACPFCGGTDVAEEHGPGVVAGD